MRKFYVGLDLGQRADFTAVAVLSTEGNPGLKTRYKLQYLDRTRGKPYSEIADDVAALMQHSYLKAAPLIVDETGVGTAVLDLLKERHLTPIPVTITAGEKVTRHGRGFHVPKRDLVSAVALVLEQRRLMIPTAISYADVLRAELQNFRSRITLRGNDSYGAGESAEWREGSHDDLVLALALAVWHAERAGRSGYTASGGGIEPPYDPYAGLSPQWKRKLIEAYGTEVLDD